MPARKQTENPKVVAADNTTAEKLADATDGLSNLIGPLAHKKYSELRKRGLIYFHLRNKESWKRIADTIEQLPWQMADFGNFTVELFIILQDSGYFTDGLNLELLNSNDKKDVDKLIRMLKQIREQVYPMLRAYVYKNRDEASPSELPR